MLLQGEISKRYIWGATLGSGNYAVVKKAMRRADQTMVAIKIIDKAKVEDLNDITVKALCTQKAALFVSVVQECCTPRSRPVLPPHLRITSALRCTSSE